MSAGWETEISLLSTFYTHLRCKIIDRTHGQILASSLINNNCPTSITIERNPYDINIKLFTVEGCIIEDFLLFKKQFVFQKNNREIKSIQVSPTVSISNSRFDLNSINSSSVSQEKFQLPKQITDFKQQGDSCTISIKVRKTPYKLSSLEFIYEQLEDIQKIRALASQAYKKIEEKALKQIKRNKENSKKLSLQTIKLENSVMRVSSMNSTLKYQPARCNGKKMKKNEWIRKIKKMAQADTKKEKKSTWGQNFSRYQNFQQKKRSNIGKLKKVDPNSVQLLSLIKSPELKKISFLRDSRIVNTQALPSCSRVQNLVSSPVNSSNITLKGSSRVFKSHQKYLSDGCLQNHKIRKYHNQTNSTEQTNHQIQIIKYPKNIWFSKAYRNHLIF